MAKLSTLSLPQSLQQGCVILDKGWAFTFFTKGSGMARQVAKGAAVIFARQIGCDMMNQHSNLGTLQEDVWKGF